MNTAPSAHGGKQWLPHALLAAAASLAVFFLYAGRSDAVFVLYDPAFYASEAERIGLASINGHHPLVHVLVLLLAKLLTLVGVNAPGFIALQLLNAASLAAIVLAYGRAARWRGTVIALVVVGLSLRGVLLSAAGGETVLPALAAALWLLIAACNAQTSVRVTTALAVITLLLRQDSILVIPAVLFALARSGHSMRSLVRFTALTGFITLALYVLLWKLSGRDPSFLAWMFALMHDPARTWGGTAAGSPSAILLLHANAWGVAAAGSFTAWSMLAGAAFTLGLPVAMGLATRLVCGAAADRRLAAAALLVLILRTGFSLWFEPGNWEWAVMGWGLVLLALSSFFAGAPRAEKFATSVGVLLLLALAAALFAQHGAATLELGQQRLSEAAQQALALGAKAGPTVAFAASSPHAVAALFAHGVDARNLDVAAWSDFQSASAGGVAHIAKDRPTVVLLDRAVGKGFGSHQQTGIPLWLTAFDSAEPPPGIVLQRLEGKVWVLGLNMPR